MTVIPKEQVVVRITTKVHHHNYWLPSQLGPEKAWDLVRSLEIIETNMAMDDLMLISYGVGLL